MTYRFNEDNSDHGYFVDYYEVGENGRVVTPSTCWLMVFYDESGDWWTSPVTTFTV